MAEIQSGNSFPQKRNLDIKGTMAGFTLASLAQAAVSSIAFLPVNIITSFQKKLSKDEVQFTNKAADKILTEATDLAKKGVKINNYTEAKGTLADILFENCPEFIKEAIDPVYATAKGKNAFFQGSKIAGELFNTVNVNKDKASLFTFLELGHAFNFNNSTFWKAMQKMRIPGMALAGIFASIPLLTKEEKAPNSEELTKGQKFKNNLRKASPLLAFASMVPMLSEEAMASVRGCKWAKQLLDPSLYKKVLKTNATAYSAYLLSALSFSVFALVGKKVKDNFQEKKTNN